MSNSSACWLPIAAMLALPACTAGDRRDGPIALTPQDASRPAAYDKLPAGPRVVHWAAVVTVACRVELDGRGSGCTVRDVNGPPAFEEPALEYARSLVFMPAFQTRHGPVEPNHIIYVAFPPHNDFAPRDVRASVAVAGSLPYPAHIKGGVTGTVRMSCTVRIDGDLDDCKVIAVEGDRAFGEAALQAVHSAHYNPAWQHGRPVPELDHRLTLVFVPPPEPFDVATGPPAGRLGEPAWCTPSA